MTATLISLDARTAFAILGDAVEAEGRRQVADASLNGIRLAIKETRQSLHLHMDSLARRYKETHDRKIIDQVNESSRRLRELEIT